MEISEIDLAENMEERSHTNESEILSSGGLKYDGTVNGRSKETMRKNWY